jgi:uncharacterized membrane protein
MDFMSVVLRWLHIVSGILWIGMLYFFNFAYSQFLPSLEGDARKTVVTGLAPRTLFWFRWGAMYTWISGLLLLGLVYYHGGLMFESDNLQGWGTASIVMVAVSFLAFGPYNALAKSPLGKNLKAFGVVAFVLTAAILYLMVSWAGFSFRAYNIHVGVMFGSIMAANVWMIIWPGQRKILAAVKEGTPPDPAIVAAAGTRSRHNTYMSVPLIWTMINAHTAVPAADSWLYLLGVIAISWFTVALLYNKAGKLKAV